MRKLTPVLVIIVLAAFGFMPASAQEIGQTVSITGCLEQEDEDGEVEFVLEDGEMGEMSVEKVGLIAGEGVALAPHVGHTVEVTGVVFADEDEADEDEGEEEGEEEGHEEGEEEEGHEDEDADELHVRVTEMRHVAASCNDRRR